MTSTALCVDVKGPGLLVVKGMLRNVMIYHAGEATFLEDEDYNTLVRLTPGWRYQPTAPRTIGL